MGSPPHPPPLSSLKLEVLVNGDSKLKTKQLTPSVTSLLALSIQPLSSVLHTPNPSTVPGKRRLGPHSVHLGQFHAHRILGVLADGKCGRCNGSRIFKSPQNIKAFLQYYTLRNSLRPILHPSKQSQTNITPFETVIDQYYTLQNSHRLIFYTLKKSSQTTYLNIWIFLK